MKSSRRGFLGFALNGFMAFAGGAILHQTYSRFSSPSVSEWDLSAISQLAPGQMIDLNQTLPKQIKLGGRFSVANGAVLPPGVSLTQEGVLSVGHDVAGSITGVVFSYDEPA